MSRAGKSGSSSLPALPKGAADVDPSMAVSDDALQKHVLRIQQTLMDSVNRQVTTMKHLLQDKEHQVDETQKQKQVLALGFRQLQNEFNRTSVAQRTAVNRVSQLEAQMRAQTAQAQVLERNVNELAKEKGALQESEAAAKTQAQSFLRKISQTQSLNAALATDLKVQHHVQQIFKKEMGALEVSKHELERELDKAHGATDALSQQKADALQQLQQQKQDTAVAQRAISKLSREMREAQKLRNTMEKQWSDALTALSKRDQAIHAIDALRSKAVHSLTEAQAQAKELASGRDQAARALAEQQDLTAATASQVASLEASLESMSSKTRDLSIELEATRSAEKKYHAELESETVRNRRLEEANTVRRQEIASLKAKLAQVQKDGETSTLVAVRQAVAQKEEEIVKSLTQRGSNAVKNAQQDAVMFRGENAKLRIQAMAATQVFNRQQHELVGAESRYRDAHKSLFSAQRQIQLLSSTIERKEYENNSLQAKLDKKQTKDDQAAAFTSEIANLNKALVIARQEQDSIQNTWLGTRKEALKESRELASLHEEHDATTLKLSVSETIKESLQRDLNTAKDQGVDARVEIAKHQLTIRQLQPELHELRQRNCELEQKLFEARNKQIVTKTEGVEAVHMLKAEVRRLYKGRSDMRQSRMMDAKVQYRLENRATLAKAMLDQATIQKQQLAKENTELRIKLADSDAGLRALKGEFHKYLEASMQRTLARRPPPDPPAWYQPKDPAASMGGEPDVTAGAAAGRTGLMENPAWRSLLSDSAAGPLAPAGEASPAGGDDIPVHSTLAAKRAEELEQSNPASDFDVPDMAAVRNRLARLTSERAFLMLENERIRSQNQQLQAAAQKDAATFTEKSAQCDRLQGELEHTTQRLNMVTRQFERAKNMAAFLEVQIKEAKPNVKINYQPLRLVDPSTQLLGALMCKGSL